MRSRNAQNVAIGLLAGKNSQMETLMIKRIDNMKISLNGRIIPFSGAKCRGNFVILAGDPDKPLTILELPMLAELICEAYMIEARRLKLIHRHHYGEFALYDVCRFEIEGEHFVKLRSKRRIESPREFFKMINAPHHWKKGGDN